METILKLKATFGFDRLKRMVVVLFTGVFMLVTTAACTPTDATDTAAMTNNQPVPEASQADIERAQGNLSDEAVNEDTLSKQGPSRARQSNGIVSPQ